MKSGLLSGHSSSLLLFLLCSCAVDAGSTEEESQADGTPESLASSNGAESEKFVQKEGLIFPPSNYVKHIEIGTGSWGAWIMTEYCPQGAYVYGIELKSEASVGTGDDTALNGVRLSCYDSSLSYMGLGDTYSSGEFGSWHPRAVTSPYGIGNPFVGGRMKIEGSQGSGDDDTAANQVALTAMNGVESVALAATSWGTWNAPHPLPTNDPNKFKCPANTAVCGVQVRREDHMGIHGDDTALNGIRLACCTFP
jgi:hypothetical protein